MAILAAGAAVTLAGTSTQILMRNSVDGSTLGAVVIGAVADLIGLQPAMICGALLTGLVFVLMLRRYKTMVSALE